MSNIINLSDRRRARVVAPSCCDAVVVHLPPSQQQEDVAAFWLGVAMLAETAAAVLRGWQQD